MVVALAVVDEPTYRTYRLAIAPFLVRYGAVFRYDFWVSEIVATRGTHDTNRVFVLSFPDRSRKEAFWVDPEFLAIKADLFARSVSQFTVVSEYHRDQ
jgi:uncharacterized protein (DUF1330 family)